MQLSTSRKKSTSVATVAFMVAAVASAAGAGYLFSNVLGANYSKGPVVPIIVAARDVPAGEPLKRRDLKVMAWPKASVPRGAFHSRRALLQRRSVPLVPLIAGSAVLTAHLSKPNGGMGVAATLKPGQRAVSVRVNMSIAFAKLLYPGAHIDLYSTLARRDRDGRREVRTTLLMQDVRVLAIGSHIDAASASSRLRRRRRRLGSSSSRRRRAMRVVTFALTPQQVSRFVLARREGKIDLALRSPKDRSKTKLDATHLSTLTGAADADAKRQRQDDLRASTKAAKKAVAAAKRATKRAKRVLARARARARARRARAKKRKKAAIKVQAVGVKKKNAPLIERD